MDFNLSFLFQISIMFAVLSLPIIYSWSKRKTTNPVYHTIAGFILMSIPVLNLIYIIYFYLKPDLVQQS